MSGMASYNVTGPGIEKLIEEGQNIIFTDPKTEIIEQIKYYRLGYDYLFLAHDFCYKGEIIEALDITILFKVYDASGVEVLFESATEEMSDQRLYFKSGDSCYLNQFYKCLIDENGSIKIIPSPRFADDLKNSYRLDIITNDEIHHPELIQNNIASGDRARELAGQLQHTLKGDQFFLLTCFVNGRAEYSGKMYL